MQDQSTLLVADDDPVGARIQNRLEEPALVQSVNAQPLDFPAQRLDARLRRALGTAPRGIDREAPGV